LGLTVSDKQFHKEFKAHSPAASSLPLVSSQDEKWPLEQA